METRYAVYLILKSDTVDELPIYGDIFVESYPSYPSEAELQTLWNNNIVQYKNAWYFEVRTQNRFIGGLQ
jgi:hypothetical protein